SQVKAYCEAATNAIKEWALAFPLEPMEEGDSEQTFVDRCASALVFVPSPKGAGSHTWPNWHLDNAKALASLEVRERARAIYEKYRPAHDEEEAEHSGEADVDDPAMGGSDGGETGDEIEEEGEGENGETNASINSIGTATPRARQQSKPNTKNKRKGGKQKGAIAKKKATPAKGFRNKRSTRGGRGGGNAKKAD
ncbi:MAG: hypothetical protein SGILL_009348, partial [Bacillariaceae sp.]